MPEEQLRDHATRLARVEQRVEDLAISVAAMAPLIAQHAQMDVRFGHMEEEIRALGTDLSSVRENLERRDEIATNERKAVRLALISLTGVILSAIIAAVAAIVVAGIG